MGNYATKAQIDEDQAKLDRAKQMSAREICDGALNSPKDGWDFQPLFKGQATEAQVRGYTIDSCRETIGLPTRQSEIQKKQQDDADARRRQEQQAALERFKQMNARDICPAALNRARDEWETNDTYKGQVAEAQARNYTIDSCRIVMGLPTRQAAAEKQQQDDADARRRQEQQAASLRIKQLTTSELCQVSLNRAKDGWDYSSAYADQLTEAKIRGLSISDCRQVLGVSDNPTSDGGLKVSIWSHNGSTVRLESNGNHRRFYYTIPRETLVSNGVRSGTLMFDGTRSGNVYSGTSYVFSSKYGARAFPVAGNVDNSDLRVVMRGQSPNVDGNCNRTGSYRAQELVFTYGAP